MRHVDFEKLALFEQILFNNKGVSGNVEHLVRFARLIQSQRQSWTSSAAGGQVDADGTFVFSRKIPVQLGFGAFG